MSTLAHIGANTKWEMLTFVMVLIFLLGFPFEWIEICLIVLPIFGPILAKYDFSDHIGNNTALMTWFGTLVAVNLQTAFMTPPFGATLFYMKGTAPPGGDHDRRVPRHVSVRRPPGAWTSAVHLFPGHQSLAA